MYDQPSARLEESLGMRLPSAIVVASVVSAAALCAGCSSTSAEITPFSSCQEA